MSNNVYDAIAVTAPAPGGSLVPTLGGEYYCDPEIFRAEQERIFESAWFCAVRSADLAAPGAVPQGPGRPRERTHRARP